MRFAAQIADSRRVHRKDSTDIHPYSSLERKIAQPSRVNARKSTSRTLGQHENVEDPAPYGLARLAASCRSSSRSAAGAVMVDGCGFASQMAPSSPVDWFTPSFSSGALPHMDGHMTRSILCVAQSSLPRHSSLARWHSIRGCERAEEVFGTRTTCDSAASTSKQLHTRLCTALDSDDAVHVAWTLHGCCLGRR